MRSGLEITWFHFKFLETRVVISQQTYKIKSKPEMFRKFCLRVRRVVSPLEIEPKSEYSKNSFGYN